MLPWLFYTSITRLVIAVRSNVEGLKCRWKRLRRDGNSLRDIGGVVRFLNGLATDGIERDADIVNVDGGTFTGEA